MKIIIDTSSLLALVRYYFPFDTKGLLKAFIEEKFISNELLIIDKVYDECRGNAKGIVLTEMDFLHNKSLHIKTVDILPNKAFFGLLENTFCNKDIKRLREINDAEFELEKEKFLNSADGKLILFAKSILKENPIIVTEETKNANDGKIFKKIPDNCHNIGLNCCTLPTLFKEHFGINISSFIE